MHRAPAPPKPDRTTTTPLPPNLAAVLAVVQILLAYGRHLAETFPRRSAAPGFHLIAKAFGTSRAAFILAHIRRGILRAAALERLLLARAARGRDLTLPRSASAPRTQPRHAPRQTHPPRANPSRSPPGATAGWTGCRTRSIPATSRRCRTCKPPCAAARSAASSARSTPISALPRRSASAPSGTPCSSPCCISTAAPRPTTSAAGSGSRRSPGSRTGARRWIYMAAGGARPRPRRHRASAGLPHRRSPG